MVSKAATSIGRSVIGFRKKFPKLFDQARRYEGAVDRSKWCLIPDKWLELQYGWKPLMSDVYGALHHLQKRNRYQNPYVNVRGLASDSAESTLVRSDSIGNTYQAKFLHEQRVETFLTYGLTNPVLAELSSLGLINPLEIVWELTKYSFVVDWFLPIGSWLSSLTADTGYSFVTGGQSVRSHCKFAGSHSVSDNSSWTTTSHAGLLYAGRGRSWYRTCYQSSPFPGLYVKSPLSTSHVANALALLAQSFR